MSKLENTPWKVEVDYDGTCEIFATDKTRERGLRWIGSAIDEETAKAIAALPETLSELERVKEQLNEEMFEEDNEFNHLNDIIAELNEQLSQTEKERDELREALENMTSNFFKSDGSSIQSLHEAQKLLTPKSEE